MIDRRGTGTTTSRMRAQSNNCLACLGAPSHRDVVNGVALRPFAPEKPYVFRIEASTTLCTYARIASVRQVSTDALT